MKDTALMTASEINKRLDKLDDRDFKLIDEMIAASRGNERPSEYLLKNDPLSLAHKVIFDERCLLRNEMEWRYGPNAPRRLPKGYGPRSRRF